MRPLRQLADRTPATRNRYVDLLRAVALVLVVLGHWLVSVIEYDRHGRLTGHSALESMRWAYPLTWLFQVLPVFFIVGGFANAASLEAVRRRGGDAVNWLQDRAARLVRPTTTLILVLAVGSLVAWPLGAEPAEVRRAVWTASIPLWFLTAYLLVVALTPVMYALHRRFGAAVPLVLLGLVALGDVARLHGHPAWGEPNYLSGWLVVHQVGFFWRDGRLPVGLRRGLPLLVGCVLALVLLTIVGPYPLTMIDVAGTRIKNSSPPSLALLATAGTQLGVIMVLHDPVQRWLRRRRPWLVVVAANSVLLTIFLWHMTALLVVAGSLSFAGVLPTPRVDTTAWWLWRMPWLLMLSAVLAVLVAVFARIEQHRGRGAMPRPVAISPVPRLLLTLGGMAAVIIGLLINNLVSRFTHERLGIPPVALAVYLAGAAVLRIVRAVPAKARSPAV